MDINDPVFEQAIAELTAKPYLGDYAQVHGLLKDFGVAVLNAIELDEDAASVASKGAETLANAFLGEDETYAIVPGWNRPGSIDAFAEGFVEPEDDPSKTIQSLLIDFISDVIGIAQFAEQEGVLDEQWTQELGLVHDRTAKILMGVTPDDLGDSEDDADAPEDPDIMEDPEAISESLASRTQEYLSKNWSEYP